MNTTERSITCSNNLCTEKGLKSCTRCRAAWYCCKECQVQHWKRHKKCCKMISSSREMSLKYYNACKNHAIGRNQSERGKFDKALLTLRNSLEIFQEFQDDVLISECYFEIGRVLNSKKQYEEALVTFRKALEICREIQGENHIQTCGCYEAIGNVLADQGRNDDAFIGYGKALGIPIILFGEHHLETANSYFNIGMVLKSKGDYGGALSSFEKAKEICSRELGSEHHKTVQTKVWSDYCRQFT